jgi:hypothetical protein
VELSSLEQDVINWFSKKSQDPALIQQLKNVQVKEREITEVGVFSELNFPADFNKGENLSQSPNPLHGPHIKSESLKSGGSSLIFISDGLISVLEITSDGDSFPKNLENYELV